MEKIFNAVALGLEGAKSAYLSGIRDVLAARSSITECNVVLKIPKGKGRGSDAVYEEINLRISTNVAVRAAEKTASSTDTPVPAGEAPDLQRNFLSHLISRWKKRT